jgi:inorganic pyrophosphatase
MFFFDVDPVTGVRTAISPWHDVPLRNADGTLNMVVEIPKHTRDKFELAPKEAFNPIRCDLKNGMLRQYAWGDMLFNYGAFPQTWENPAHVEPATGEGGDNDPLDVIDIGGRQWATGSIIRVKLLGILGLIDTDETDWKVLAVSATDPLAPVLNDIEDVRIHMPGTIEALTKWLKLYKSSSGIINRFAWDGEARGREVAEAVIAQTHVEWQRLIDERGAHAVLPSE